MTAFCNPLPRTELHKDFAPRLRSLRAKTAFQRSRIFPRHVFDLRVRLLISGRRTPLPARTNDLSYGGASVTVFESLAIGAEVVLILRMKKSEHEVRLPARITHRKGSRCGLQFTQLSPEQKILVQRICKALAGVAS